MLYRCNHRKHTRQLLGVTLAIIVLMSLPALPIYSSNLAAQSAVAQTGNSKTAAWSHLNSGANVVSAPSLSKRSKPIATLQSTTTSTSAPPANDDFVNAQVISGISGNVTASNVGATKEVGEANHAGDGGGKSVWYRWQAPSSGVLSFNTFGSNFDTLLASYTGSSVSALLEIASNDDASDDLTSCITFNVTAGTVYQIAVDGFGGSEGDISLNWSLCESALIPPPDPQAVTLTFGELPTQPVNGLSISGVTFSFQIAGAASTDAQYNSAGPGTLLFVQDPSLEGNAAGVLTLRFATPTTLLRFGAALSTGASLRPGFTVRLFDASSNTLGVFSVDTSPQPCFFFTESLFNYSGPAVSRAEISFNAAAATRFALDNLSFKTLSNPIDDAQFFVRQHYLDFLNREPDADGLAFWTNEITSCGGDAQCVDAKRINVSAAYFLSIEFQQTGYLVYRIYKASYGSPPNAPVPIRLNEFLPDTKEIGQGVIVNQAGWEQTLENNKQAFAAEFVQRSRFTTAYATSMSPDQFVDTLFANAGITPSAPDRTDAIGEFGSAMTTSDTSARSRALRRVVENSTLTQQEFNRAFVLMQYFGYLRRNPNDAPDANFDGYNFWLTKLNQFNGDFVQAQMVKAFIVSTEYRQRFGQ